MSTAEPDAVLREWTARLVEALDLDPAVVDIDEILALAGEAAHGVVRPAAPLTTFLVGYAAGLRSASATTTMGAGATDGARAALTDARHRAESTIVAFAADHPTP